MDKKLNLVSKQLRFKAEAFLNSRSLPVTANDQDTNAMEIIQELLDQQTLLESQNRQLLESEMEFHKERDYYKDIFNNQPAGLYRIRVFHDGKRNNKSWISSRMAPYTMEIASQRFCEILGVTLADFKQNPHIIVDVICDEDKESFVNANEEANEKLIPFKWEGRLSVKGKLKWIRLESLPRVVKNGDILWTGILYDVTNAKLAEEALKESEEKYRLLFVANPQPMWIFDCDTLEFMEVNESALIHYGYSRNEFMSMSTIDIRPPEDIPIFLNDVDNIVHGLQMIGERRHKKKNGEVFFVEVTASIIYYQGKLANHVLIKDITERKRAEDSLFNLNQQLEKRVAERTSDLLELNLSLQYAKEKLRTVADYTYNWEYWKSPEGEILYMSPSVERITGYTADEFTNNPDLINTVVYNEDAESWKKHSKHRHSVLNNEVLEFVFRIVKKDGDVRWIGHICRCIYNENGIYMGVRVSN